jgi:hypothetical protein
MRIRTRISAHADQPASVLSLNIAEEESSSFLKKRTKKLLFITDSAAISALAELPDAFCKSFLLFFKKEESFLD